MEDIFGELVAETGLGDFFDGAADVLVDLFGGVTAEASDFTDLISAGVDLDASSVLSAADLDFDSSSIFGDASLNESTFNASSDAIQILDPFSDLDGNELRDSLQVSGLDLDENRISDQLQFNTDTDGNGTSNALQFGVDLNGNGLVDQYDISVDSDLNGISDSAQSTRFDLDGNGFNDVSTFDNVLKIKSGIPPKWF